MIPYITYREPNEEGILCYYILQKYFPHFSGLLVANRPIDGAIVNAPIAGYNLFITFNGTLRGNIIPNYKNIQEEIITVFEDMSSWYLINRILLNEKLYRKFKIVTDDNSTNR